MKARLSIIALALVFLFACVGCNQNTSTPPEDTVTVKVSAPTFGTVTVKNSEGEAVATVEKGNESDLVLTKDGAYTLSFTHTTDTTKDKYVTTWSNAVKTGRDSASFTATEGLSISALNGKFAKKITVTNGSGEDLVIRFRGPDYDDATAQFFHKETIASSDTASHDYYVWKWDTKTSYQSAVYFSAPAASGKQVTIAKTNGDEDAKQYAIGVAESPSWNQVSVGTAPDIVSFDSTQKEDTEGIWTLGVGYVPLSATEDAITVSATATEKSIKVTNGDGTEEKREITVEQSIVSPDSTYFGSTGTKNRVIMPNTHAQDASVTLGLCKDTDVSVAYTNKETGSLLPSTVAWNNISDTGKSQTIAYADVKDITTTGDGYVSDVLSVTAPAEADIKVTPAGGTAQTITKGTVGTVNIASAGTSVDLELTNITEGYAPYAWTGATSSTDSTKATVTVTGSVSVSATMNAYKSVTMTAPASVALTVSDFTGPKDTIAAGTTAQSVEIAGGASQTMKMWTYADTLKNIAQVVVKDWATTYTTDTNLTGKYLNTDATYIYTAAATSVSGFASDNMAGFYQKAFVPVASAPSAITFAMKDAKAVTVTITGVAAARVRAYQYIKHGQSDSLYALANAFLEQMVTTTAAKVVYVADPADLLRNEDAVATTDASYNVILRVYGSGATDLKTATYSFVWKNGDAVITSGTGFSINGGKLNWTDFSTLPSSLSVAVTSK